MDSYDKQKKSGGIFLGGGIFLFFIGVASASGFLIFFGIVMIAVGVIILRQVQKTDNNIGDSNQEHIDRVVHTYTYDPSKQKVDPKPEPKNEVKKDVILEQPIIESEVMETKEEPIESELPKEEVITSNSPYKNETSFKSTSSSPFEHKPMFSNEPMFKGTEEGKRFQDQPSFKTESFNTSRVTFASTDGKRCYNCHELNKNEAVVCEHCGTVLAHECKNCGKVNDINARFCQSCGRPLV